MLGYCQLDAKDKIKCNLNHNIKLFNQENASENIVREMAAILCMGEGMS